MKPVKLSYKKWGKLYSQLQKDYPPSVVLIRARMKEKLGFTQREYRDWDYKNHRWRDNCIMLDFYCERKRTFFLMKYSEYI